MKTVLKMYGVFFIEAIVVIALFALCSGQDYLKTTGKNMPVEEKQYVDYTDVKETYCLESQKEVPTIVYENRSFNTGEYLLTEWIKAYDYADQTLDIKVHSILNPNQEELAVNGEKNIQVKFEIPGVYQIKVSATDDGNRCRVCTIKIPVNAKAEIG